MRRHYARNIFLILTFTTLLGCEKGFRFLVCPYECSSEIRAQNDLGQQREILFRVEYDVLVVSRNNQNEISPINHYRAEHTFTDNILPEKVSWQKPLHISTLIIIDKPPETFGVAVKKKADSAWKVYWVGEEKLGEIQKTGIVFLPPYERLPVIAGQK